MRRVGILHLLCRRNSRDPDPCRDSARHQGAQEAAAGPGPFGKGIGRGFLTIAGVK